MKNTVTIYHRGHKYEISIEEITPITGAMYLERNVNNYRDPITNKINQYARDMIDSRWHLNGATVVFDHKGNLTDGQNRLTAGVDAQETFETFVIRGVRTDKGVDKGKIRTIANYLGRCGWPKDPSFTAMVRMCYKYEDHTILEYNPSPTEDDILEYCEQNVTVLESFECCNNAKVKSVIPPSNAAFIHFMGGKMSGLPKEASAFITVIRNGEMRYAGDPAFIYRDTILKAKARGVVKRNTVLHLGIKAFNHAIKRTKISSRHLSIPTGRFLWSRPVAQGNSVVLEKFLTREVL